ncbi:MAG: hypothetical protein ACQESP_09695 [Candidatus Muiribacteriota bacterium]
MKKFINIIFLSIVMMVLISGCGAKSDLARVHKATADFENAWSHYENGEYEKADTIFSEILMRESDVETENEARVGIAMLCLSNPDKVREVEGQLMQNVEAANYQLENIFSRSYDTIYEPVYNKNIGNGEARGFLALTYMLMGNTERFNQNLNIAKIFSNQEIDSENMLKSLDEML